MKNIAAFTPPSGHFPPYLSINLTDQGLVRITVRSTSDLTAGTPTYEVPGMIGNIELSLSEFDHVLGQVERSLEP